MAFSTPGRSERYTESKFQGEKDASGSGQRIQRNPPTQKAYEEKLATAEALRKKYETHVKYAKENLEEFRELIKPRKLNFDGPSNRKVLPTPKDNMFKAAEVLNEKDEKIDLNLLRQIVGTAVKQQSKADTARRIASDPELCQSTARAEPNRRSRDSHSRTISPERRRKEGNNRDNPINVPSRDKGNGKRLVHSNRDQHHMKPPMPEKRRDPTPHRQTGHARNTTPHGPGGINIRDHNERPWGRSNDRNDREHYSTHAGDNHHDGGKSHRSQSRSS